MASPPRTASSSRSLLATIWSARHDPASRILNVDLLAVLMAALLPWSTSGVAILSVLWLTALLWTLEIQAFAQAMKRPAFWLPVALFALAVAGMLWSVAPWSVRFHAAGQAVKLLFLPLIMYHFQRTPRGKWVFVAFLASCMLMLAMSWMAAVLPAFTMKPVRVCGVFVKNYIDQSQEFAFCVLALALPVMTLWREGKRRSAAWLMALAIAFIANMVFVIASRTALATMPLLLAVFAVRYLPWRGILVLGIVGVLAGAAWAMAPRMCRTVETISRDIALYQQDSEPTSAGLRVEYWSKSLRFIQEAPLVGHGTGSIRGLFEKARVGQAGRASEQVVSNPHNQTLSVAIQWGTIGVILLYAMWLSHLLLFRGGGFVAWIGFLVVAQNVLSSLFNSHLFDFHAGWMYVLGVGVAGGTLLGGAGKGGRDGVSAASLRESRDFTRS